LSLEFQRVFDLLPDAYVLLDRELRYVAANRAYLALTSSRPDELVGRYVFDVFPDDGNSAMLRQSFARVLERREADTIALMRYDVTRTLVDGTRAKEERFWSTTQVPLLDENGEVEHILQHVVDVTDLYRSEATAPGNRAQQGVLVRARIVQEAFLMADEEREHLRRLFEQAPGFVAFLRGREHVFDIANAAYLKLVGHRSILGMRVRDALPEVTEQGFLELLDHVYTTGEPFVGHALPLVLQHTPGGPPEEVLLDFVYQPILDRSGQVSGIFVSGNDVTKLRRAEEEVRFLAEAIPQQVWTAQPDGQLDFVNERVVEYFGMPREQILGQGWQSIIHPNDLPEALVAWEHALRTGDAYETQFRLRRGDGAYRWHLGRALARHDGRGAIIRWYGTSTDIDEARRARDELERRAEFEQQVIGIVSHDLKNPLAAINLSAALLARRGQLSEQQAQIAARIVLLSQRAARLVRDFLDFSQARSTGSIPIERGPVDLPELTRTVVEEVRLANPGRDAVVEHHGESNGDWDGDRLAQVIGNLVANAFQHSPAGAVVRVTSRVEGNEALIAVHNDGPPIPAADRERLFVPFKRGERAADTAARSVGLGLYICRAIVEAHGGRIDVESAVDSGTTFTVRLPR